MSKICLQMIVKNEAHIIEQALKSALYWTDYYQISDTGSTDNTIEVIENFYKKHGKKGEIFRDEWRDFGYNRSILLKRGYKLKGIDYIFWMDADDILHNPNKARIPKVNFDGIFMKCIRTGCIFSRLQLFNTRTKWYFHSKIHEFPVCMKRDKVIEHLDDNVYLETRGLGDRSKNYKETYLKDAKLCLEMYETDIDFYKPRHMLMAGNCYKSAKEWDEAVKCYEKFTHMFDGKLPEGSNWEEFYVACIQLIDIYMNEIPTEIHKKRAENYAKLGIKVKPERVEAYYQMAQLKEINNEISEALSILEKCLDLPEPSDSFQYFKGLYDNRQSYYDNLYKHKYEYNFDWFYRTELYNVFIKNFDNLKENHILEIGCYEGLSTCYFSDYLINNDLSSLVCVDTLTETEEIFERNIKKSKNYDKIKVVKKNSNEFFESNIKRFTLIYINGKIENLKDDLENSIRVLVKGGLIIFEEYLKDTNEYHLILDEFYKKYEKNLYLILNNMNAFLLTDYIDEIKEEREKLKVYEENEKKEIK